MQNNKCTGDCLKCSFQQQTYCAAQRGYAIMSYMPAIVERLDKIESALAGFSSGPVISLSGDAAQKDSGAENRESGS